MAHTIQVPASFEFRRIKVDWIDAKANIVGWQGEDFEAEVVVRATRRTITYERDDLPPKILKQCNEAFRHDEEQAVTGDDLALLYSDSVKRICAGFQPGLFVPSRKRYLFDSETSLPADAWQLRGAFLRVTADRSSLLAFLNSWGRWSIRHYVLLPNFVRFQETVRRALTSPAEEWFQHGHADLNPWKRISEYPYNAIKTTDCEDAICTTVTIDLLRQVKFKTCARQDCGQPFPIESRHKRKYCTQYCGHLESVEEVEPAQKNHGARPGGDAHKSHRGRVSQVYRF